MAQLPRDLTRFSDVFAIPRIITDKTSIEGETNKLSRDTGLSANYNKYKVRDQPNTVNIMNVEIIAVSSQMNFHLLYYPKI